MEIKTDLLLDYTVEMAYITKRSANSLTILNPRKLRKSQIQSLTSILMNGEHFDSCLVVNRGKGYHLNVIDGQHRVMAMRNYFKKYPEARIQVALAVYKNLKSNEEREVYRKWNIPIKQTTDDFINSYKEEIPMFNRLTTEMHCTVYGSPSKMKLRDLVNAHIAINEKPYKGGEKKTTYDFVKYMQKLTDEDLDSISSTFKIFQDIFNSNKIKDFHKLSAFKNIVFRALYYLIANNLEPLGENYVKRRMNTVLANRTIVDQYRRFYGRRASVDAYLAFKNLLNDTQSEKKFI